MLIDIHFFFKDLKVVKVCYYLSFIVYWAIKDKQMANVWNFDTMPKSYRRTSQSLTESNVQTFIICLFCIAQRAVKSWIIAKPL